MADELKLYISTTGGRETEHVISAIGDAAEKTSVKLDKFHDALGTMGGKGMAASANQISALDKLNEAMGTAAARNLAVSADKTSASVGKLTRDFALMERAGATGLRTLVGGFGLVATSAAAAGLAVGSVVQAGRVAVELGRLGGESLTVKDSFVQMTDSVDVSTNLLYRMQDAAGGTISTLKLLELANYSMIGVTGEVGNAIGNANDQLIEIARAAFKARPSLQSVEFAYQSLVDGIKRVEKRLVDNLGLQVKALEANEKYAAAVGKSVDELTAEEVQLAFLNEVLRAGGILIQQVGGDVGTMNDAFSRADAAATNLSVALGERFAPAVVAATNAWAGFLETLAQPLLSSEDQTQYRMKILRAEIEALSAAYSKAQADAERDPFGLGAANAEQLAIQLKQAKDELYALETATNAARFATENAARVAREYAEDTSVLEAIVRETTTAFLGLISVMREFAALEGGILDKAQEAFDKSLGSTVRSLASMGANFAVATSEGRNLAQQVAELEWLKEKGILSTELYNYQMGILDGKLKDLKDSYKDVTGKAKEFHDEFRDGLASMVSANLAPSFDVAGLAPELSVREDEVDEHYRRLAAIAIRGQEELDKHQTDWANTLAEIPEDVKAKGIEAIQAWAKDKVLAYDKGLDFSLINRDTLKKRIMEALLAEEMKKQLVEEITAELGGAVSQAQVEAAAGMALGGTPLGQISLGGVTFGAAEKPPDMSAAAEQVSAEFNKAWRDKFNSMEMLQLTAAKIIGSDMKSVYAAGQVVGSQTLSGITDAVTSGAPDITNKLALAIAPSVARILAQQNRRTGQ